MGCSDKLSAGLSDCQEDIGTPIDSVRVITPENYAELKKVSLKTVYNWINSGKVQTVKQFKKKLILV